MKALLRFLAKLVVAGTMVWWPIDGGTQPAPPPSRAPDTCLVVDTDANLDDLRAIAVLAPYWRIAAVVASDGILEAEFGAPTLARFLAALDRSALPLVVQGRARDPVVAVPNWGWRAEARSDAMRMEAALAQIGSERTETLAADDPSLGHALARALTGCARIGLVSLGPWTSLSDYHGHIKDRLAFVVGQGRSPEDPDEPEWDRVNCGFDLPSCRAAMAALNGVPQSWVDLIYPGQPEFRATDAMVSRLGDTPLARSLRRFMEADDGWKLRKQQLWDDAPAAFMVCPGAFRIVGRHHEPARSPGQMEVLVANLASGAGRCEP